jgi:methylated-DNA-[protein]-cysteine S-methyltransferase
MTNQHLARFETAFGLCTIWWTERGLARVRLPGDVANGASDEAEPNDNIPTTVQQCITRMQDYFCGDVVDFSTVALDDSALTPDAAAIYRALRTVGWGTTTTYGALAEAVGMSGAARAIGVAMARNPWPLIVPCHRVLAAGGKLGGFSAAGGTRSKERMLALELVQIGAIQPVLPGLM